MKTSTNNTRIRAIERLISPCVLYQALPLPEEIRQHMIRTRAAISAILHGRDQRLLIIVGPCSIHDYEATLDYAKRLSDLANKVNSDILVVMRVYFEKPRTTVGWKGLINDPELNDSNNINTGLHLARQLLLEINAIGLPVATEFLDTLIPQYIADLVAWAAIGARTAESQLHRNLASGLSMPVGFKNGTTGDIRVAIDAAYVAQRAHNFLGITDQGEAAIVSTTGNEDAHIILRGGSYTGPNYMPKCIAETAEKLVAAGIDTKLIVDCSHDNSNKDHTKQKNVVAAVVAQLLDGVNVIAGMMIESNLMAGNQQLMTKAQLRYGQSITDACIGWEETATLLTMIATKMHDCRNKVES